MNQLSRLAAIMRELEVRQMKAEFVAAGWNANQAEYEARTTAERIAAMTPEEVNEELKCYRTGAKAGKELAAARKRLNERKCHD